jgi:predicted DNA-binding transcriptional regulator AlpA
MQSQDISSHLDQFKKNFKELDDSVLISPEQWSALTGQSRASVYSACSRELLPAPVIKRNRLVRWTAGQYRAWTRGLADAPTARVKPAGGRPRGTLEVTPTGVQK